MSPSLFVTQKRQSLRGTYFKYTFIALHTRDLDKNLKDYSINDIVKKTECVDENLFFWWHHNSTQNYVVMLYLSLCDEYTLPQ